jgi:heme-degrading monooxygenase HmoA
VHARVTTFAVRLGHIVEAVRQYNERILPVVKAAHGNCGVMLLMGPTSGQGLSITLWHTDADAQAYESSGAYRAQVAEFRPFLSAPPSAVTYEVEVEPVLAEDGAVAAPVRGYLPGQGAGGR